MQPYSCKFYSRMIKLRLMSTERKPEIGDVIHDLEAALNKIDGFFSGKNDEREVEIEEVNAWPNNIKLGAVIKRKDQELAALEKLQKEDKRSKDFLEPLLREIIEKYTKPTPETSE